MPLASALVRRRGSRHRDEESAISETPLDTVEGWSDEHVTRLREVWITSAEQVAALAATAGGVTSLAQQLATTEERARDLVEKARAAVPRQTLTELDTPVDTSDYGLGVLRPPPDTGPLGRS